MTVVAVRQSAEAEGLVLLGEVIAALDISDAAEIEQLKRLIPAASSTIARITDRCLGRELVTEKFGLQDIDVGRLSSAGQVTHRMMLQRRPVLMIEEIRFDGDAISLDNVVLEDPEAGFIFSANGFSGTVIKYQQIEQVRTRFADPLWEVDYSAGYILPSFPEVEATFTTAEINTTTDVLSITNHDLVNGDTIRFKSDGTLPAILASKRDYFARDVVTNVSFKVATQKGGAAIDFADGGTGTHTVIRQTTLPADLQNATIELVNSMFQGRRRDRNVKSERLGDYSVTYDDGAMSGGIPASIMQALERYREVV